MSAGNPCIVESPLDGKDGEGAAMVERRARRRYPSVPSHQGESVIGRSFTEIRLLTFEIVI